MDQEQPTAEEVLRARWRALWSQLRLAGDPEPAGTSLIRAWAAPQRHYHNLERLVECLAVFEDFRAEAFRPLLVETAIWFHDVVHDTRRSDSEQQSVVWAERVLGPAGLPAADLQAVRNLILVTRPDAVPLPGDEALMHGIERVVLAAPPDRFDRAQMDLRWESAHVPAPAYRQARRQAVEALLREGPLFVHPALRKRFETTARDNLARSLRRQWRIS